MSADYGTEALLDGSLNPTTHARATDPAASHAAARALSPKHTMLRHLLTYYSQVHADTAEGAAIACGYTAADGAWKRVSDLLRAGLLEDTGASRAGMSGRQQRVLRISDYGRNELRVTSPVGIQ